MARVNKLYEKPLATTIGATDRMTFGQLQIDGSYTVKTITRLNEQAQSVTYAQLTALVTASTLVPMAWYKITNATSAGVTLFVQASGVNTIGSTALNPNYPTRVYEYDFTNNIILSVKSNQTFNKMFGTAKLDYGESLLLFGDSLTVGQGASNQTHAFGNIISAQHRLTLSNNAVGGAGVWRAIKEANALLGFGDFTQNIFWMPGFNDIRRNPSTTKTTTYNKIDACMKALITGNWLTEVYAGSDTQVSKFSGTWTNINLASAGGKSNQNAKSAIQNSVSGSELRYDVNGDNLIISVFGCDTTTPNRLGTLDIYVDGVLNTSYNPVGRYDGIADDTYSNGQGPDVIYLSGLGSSVHSIRIVKTDNYPTYFDYVGQLIAPQLCSPILIGETTFMTSAGLLVTPTGATNADVQVENELILGIIEDFQPYPIYFVPTNAYTNLTTGIANDNIHWNDINQILMANAINTRL